MITHSVLAGLANTWVKASWDEFLAVAATAETQSDLKKASFYYDNGCMRIEKMPTGFSHGHDHYLLSVVIGLYGTFKNLAFLPVDNTSFRKEGEQECQPDLAFYIGDPLPTISRTNDPIDINLYGPPNLVIEISATSLSDDLGQKRLLYERLGVQEYWVVEAAAARITAFTIFEGGSRSVRASAVLPELQISVIEEALQRHQNESSGAVNRWLISQFS